MSKWKENRVYVLLAAIVIAGIVIIAYKNIMPPIPLELTPGVYTGTGEGYGGEITVTATVGADGTITDVAITGADESPDIGGKYIEDGTFAGQIIEDQHYDIDGVSGATYTTYGVREAAEAALSQGEQ